MTTTTATQASSKHDREAPVQEIIDKIKSQGLFDQFRKEYLADVDTKPAYHNLKQRVEGYVTRFLSSQKWSQSLNKNQLRDSLRKHINQSGMLTNGVERIIEQVVNPKILQVIKPKLDEMVCKHFGVDPKEHQEQVQRRKQQQQQQQQQNMVPSMNMMPAVPGSAGTYNPMMPPGSFINVPPPQGGAWPSQTAPFPAANMPGLPMPPMPFAPPGFPFSLVPQPFSYMQAWGPGYPGMDPFNPHMVPPQAPLQAQPQGPPPQVPPPQGPPAGIAPPIPPLPAQQFPPANVSLPGATPDSTSTQYSLPPGTASLPMVPPGTTAPGTPPPPGTEIPNIMTSLSSGDNTPIPNVNLMTPPPPLPVKASPVLPGSSTPAPPVRLDTATPPPPTVSTPLPHASSVSANTSPGPTAPPPSEPLSKEILRKLTPSDGKPDAGTKKPEEPKRPSNMITQTLKLDEIPLPSQPELKKPENNEDRSFKKTVKKPNNESKRGPDKSVERSTDATRIDSMFKFGGLDDSKEPLSSSDSSEYEGEEGIQASPPKQVGSRRQYNFAWDQEGQGDISDVTVSSIHTSDLSSFEASDSEGDSSQSHAGEEKRKEYSNEGVEESPSPRKDPWKNLDVQKSIQMEINTESVENSCPQKPRKLLALSYNLSDSDDNETREERKARIAKEKEERYLRRLQRRTELENKRKEREEERTKVREEKRKSKNAGASSQDTGPEESETKSSSLISDLNSSMDCGGEVPFEQNKRKRRTKEEAKEQLMQQKVMEKRLALRRQRTRNRRYTSEEFETIFTEKKQPYTSQSYVNVEEGVEQTIEIDTTVSNTMEHIIPLENIPKSPPTPTQDEQDDVIRSVSDIPLPGESEGPVYEIATTLQSISQRKQLQSRMSDDGKSNESFSSYRPSSPYSDISDISKSESEKSLTRRRRTASGESNVSDQTSARRSLRSTIPPEDNRSLIGRRSRLKSPESVECRRGNQRYNTDDLYKPRLSHRRPLTPPVAHDPEDSHSLGLRSRLQSSSAVLESPVDHIHLEAKAIPGRDCHYPHDRQDSKKDSIPCMEKRAEYPSKCKGQKPAESTSHSGLRAYESTSSKKKRKGHISQDSSDDEYDDDDDDDDDADSMKGRGRSGSSSDLEEFHKHKSSSDSESSSSESDNEGNVHKKKDPDEEEEEGMVHDDEEDSEGVGNKEDEEDGCRRKDRMPIELVDFGEAEKRMRQKLHLVPRQKTQHHFNFGQSQRHSWRQERSSSQGRAKFRSQKRMAQGKGPGQGFRQFGQGVRSGRPGMEVKSVGKTVNYDGGSDPWILGRPVSPSARSPACSPAHIDGSGSPVKRQYSSEIESTLRRPPSPPEPPRGPRTPSPEFTGPRTRRQPLSSPETASHAQRSRSPVMRCQSARQSSPLRVGRELERGQRSTSPSPPFRETRRMRKPPSPPFAPSVLPTGQRQTRRTRPASPVPIGAVRETRGRQEKGPPSKRARR